MSIRLCLLGFVVVVGVTSACQSVSPQRPADERISTQPVFPVPVASVNVLNIRAVIDGSWNQKNPPSRPTDSPDSAPAASGSDVAAAKHARQNVALASDPALQEQAVSSLDCSRADPLVGYEDSDLPLVACDGYGAKFVMDKAFLTDKDVASAVAVPGRGMVDLTLTDTARGIWADFTAKNVGKQVAILFKASIVTAAQISAPMEGGVIHLTGRFDEYDAQNMAKQITGH
jgi:preprotein translocase subunit SecD